MKHNIQVHGYLAQIGNVICELTDLELVEKNPFFCPDADKINALEELIHTLTTPSKLRWALLPNLCPPA